MYRAALEKRPSPDEAADVYFNMGNALERLGRPLEAEQAYRYALSLVPTHLASRTNLGSLLIKVGRHEDAIQELSSVESGEAKLNLGVALERSGRIEEAREAYEGAILANSEDPRPFVNLGMMDRALQCFEKAAALAPEDPELRFNVAQALDDMDDLEGAIAGYRETLAMGPHAGASNNLALALERRGAPLREVLELLESAVKTDPQDSDAWINLGSMREQSNDLEGAYDAYHTAASMNNLSTSTAHRCAAQIAAQRGKLQLAIDHAKPALRYAVNPEDLTASRELLRDLLTIWRETLNFDD